ncbi:hypothetical protein NEFER03_1554 [Nematocida sp. LUAm3]|nr:hypothetical protein NEFER03_1554 [Nematocida sp. LUAm3]KAI5174587.1 hypothetical protein NEFER02_0708 [Nematocida sp. LUAm2]KAI5178007.1 hypothetical protein NEFER01_1189 [Nematocida sp. LUAm1]
MQSVISEREERNTQEAVRRVRFEEETNAEVEKNRNSWFTRTFVDFNWNVVMVLGALFIWNNLIIMLCTHAEIMFYIISMSRELSVKTLTNINLATTVLYLVTVILVLIMTYMYAYLNVVKKDMNRKRWMVWLKKVAGFVIFFPVIFGLDFLFLEVLRTFWAYGMDGSKSTLWIGVFGCFMVFVAFIALSLWIMRNILRTDRVVDFNERYMNKKYIYWNMVGISALFICLVGVFSIIIVSTYQGVHNFGELMWESKRVLMEANKNLYLFG